MAAIDGSSERRLTLNASAVNEIAIGLAGAHAAADVLAMLAQGGGLDSLKASSLSRALLELEERLGALRVRLEREVRHG